MYFSLIFLFPHTIICNASNDLDFSGHGQFTPCMKFFGLVLGIVIDVHAELYKDSEADQEPDTCYLIVLTTNGGMVKLDMMDDYQRYKMWAMTINHMLMLSTSFTKYELQFYKT